MAKAVLGPSDAHPQSSSSGPVGQLQTNPLNVVHDKNGWETQFAKQSASSAEWLSLVVGIQGDLEQGLLPLLLQDCNPPCILMAPDQIQ